MSTLHGQKEASGMPFFCPFWAKTIVQLVYANDGFLPQIWQRQLSC